MLTSSKPSSDSAFPHAGAGHLVVLEGMPGVGKTTTADALAELGHAVVGEYTDDEHATIAVHAHPGIDDDDAHQFNWLRKAARCTSLLDQSPVAYADRDWLSSLSYAYSTAHGDRGALLTQRVPWALGHLADGTLLLPGLYVLFDLDPATSVARRAGRLRAGHPWNSPEALDQLQRFYRDPVSALRPVSPELAEALTLPARITVSGHNDPPAVLRQLVSLASPAREAR
jgi:thymidylate kinase